MIRSAARIDHPHPRCPVPRCINSTMSERDILAQWLGRAGRRLRLDSCLRESAALLCWLLCAAALYQAIRLVLAVREVLAALLPLFLLGGVALVALFAWRLSRRPTLQQIA